MKKKKIIFSFKGVLAMSDDHEINIWRKSLKKHGLSPDEILIYEYYGEDFQTVVLPKMSAKYHWTKSQVQAVVDSAQENFKEISDSINANLLNQLLALKEKGFTFGILSNRKRSEVEKGLKEIGLSIGLFDHLKTAENGAPKPDPRAFDILFEKFDPEEIVFVGSDPNKDWAVARSLGIEFVAISTPNVIGFWSSAGVAFGIKKENIFFSVTEYLDSLLQGQLP